MVPLLTLQWIHDISGCMSISCEDTWLYLSPPSVPETSPFHHCTMQCNGATYLPSSPLHSAVQWWPSLEFDNQPPTWTGAIQGIKKANISIVPARSILGKALLDEEIKHVVSYPCYIYNSRQTLQTSQLSLLNIYQGSY